MKKYLVGGAVRDQLLNFPFFERDWVVVGSTPEEMNEEYALARTERKTAPGYKGFTFHADTSVTLEEDLERRDLTINAMAQDHDGDIIDPHDGQDDLEKRKLRHVSLAFTEDPVRVLRVARFSARYHHLGFTVANETLDLMYAMVKQGETKHLVAERVWQELAKTLKEQSPQQFFSTLSLCDALTDIFPEFTPEYYPKCIKLLTKITSVNDDTQLRFAAICYPLRDEEIRSLCKRLGTPNEYRDAALLLKQHAETIISLARNYLHNKADSSLTREHADEMANLLKKMDASRKEERFIQIINGAAILFYGEEQEKSILFWNKARQHYLDVNPKTLIEKGYEKSDLGKALFQQRINQLSSLLSNYSDITSTHYE